MHRIPAPGDPIPRRSRSKRIPMMNTKKGKPDVIRVSLLFVALLFVLAIAFFVLPAISGGNSSKPVEVPSNQSNNTTVLENTTNASDANLTSEEEDKLDCFSLPSESERSDCFKKHAKDSLDYCVQVDSYSDLKSCIRFWVKKTGNTKLCSKLSDSDYLDCGLLVDSCFGRSGEERNLCLAVEKNDLSFCDTVDCVMKFAKEKSDKSACSQFDLPANKFACLSVVENRDACSELVLDVQKDACYSKYAIYSGDLDLCGKISEMNSYAQDCYTHFAVQNKDISLCSKLSLDARWSCYTNYALEVGDLKGCDFIDKNAPASKTLCYLSYSKTYPNPKACESLEGNVQKVCYTHTTDPSVASKEVCENISAQYWKDFCLSRFE